MSYTTPELLRDHAFFVQPSVPTSATSAPADPLSLQSKVTELEAEVGRLREQLGKAKGVNDVMWETVVQKVVGQKKDKEKDKIGVSGVSGEAGDMEVDGERRQKRGRT
jgi:pre-rRNA-processing protein IPI3